MHYDFSLDTPDTQLNCATFFRKEITMINRNLNSFSEKDERINDWVIAIYVLLLIFIGVISAIYGPSVSEFPF